MSGSADRHFRNLVEDWRKGDLSACDQLFDLYYSQMVRSAQALLAKFSGTVRCLEARDLVHEIYVPLRKQTNLEFRSSRHFINRAKHLMALALNDRLKYSRAGKRDSGYKEVSWCRLNTDR